MKVVFGLIVLVLLGIGIAVMSGGLSSPDPTEQAMLFVQSVKEGMTWDQVVDVREPKKYHAFNPDAMGGRGPDTPFSRDAVADAVKNNRFEYGFGFDYNFSAGVAYSVSFDETGKLLSVDKKMTEKDLLEGKAFHGGGE